MNSPFLKCNKPQHRMIEQKENNKPGCLVSALAGLVESFLTCINALYTDFGNWVQVLIRGTGSAHGLG